MTVKWSDLKGYILAGMLKDPDMVEVTDAQMLTWARWACAAISAHTAEAATLTYACDGVKFQFDLPADLIGGVEKAALVAYTDSGKIQYLDSIRRMASVVWPAGVTSLDNIADVPPGYWEWPYGKLTLSFVPPATATLSLHYFKIWTPPIDGNSLLTFPQYLEQAFCYFVAAFSMDPDTRQFSGINEWRRRQDSGTPEHNPAIKQSDYFMRRAQEELGRYTPQDRETFYKVNPRKLMGN